MDFTGKHILLLLLYSEGTSGKINEPISGRTRLVKMMFIFDKEIKKDFQKNSDVSIVSFPDFSAWNYGPFSKDIYTDLEFFINNGFIEDISVDKNLDDVEIEEYSKWMEYVLLERVNDIKCEVKSEISEEKFVLTGRGLDFVREKVYGKLTDNQKQLLRRLKSSMNNASLDAILRYVYLKYPNFTEKSVIKNKILG